MFAQIDQKIGSKTWFQRSFLKYGYDGLKIFLYIFVFYLPHLSRSYFTYQVLFLLKLFWDNCRIICNFNTEISYILHQVYSSSNIWHSNKNLITKKMSLIQFTKLTKISQFNMYLFVYMCVILLCLSELVYYIICRYYFSTPSSLLSKVNNIKEMISHLKIQS